MAAPHESDGGTAVDAAFGEGGEDSTEDVVDIGRGVEVAGQRGGDFRAKLLSFEVLLLDVGVIVAERWMAAGAEHAAAATIGIAEKTGLTGIGGTFGSHGKTSDEVRMLGGNEVRNGTGEGEATRWRSKEVRNGGNRFGFAGRRDGDRKHGAEYHVCLLYVNSYLCWSVSSFERAVEKFRTDRLCGRRASSRKARKAPAENTHQVQNELTNSSNIDSEATLR